LLQHWVGPSMYTDMDTSVRLLCVMDGGAGRLVTVVWCQAVCTTRCSQWAVRVLHVVHPTGWALGGRVKADTGGQHLSWWSTSTLEVSIVLEVTIIKEGQHHQGRSTSTLVVNIVMEVNIGTGGPHHHGGQHHPGGHPHHVGGDVGGSIVGCRRWEGGQR
jgi:hypothetical protein